MSKTITVTVLPEKQLRHVLERDGYVRDEDGDYMKVGEYFDYEAEMFEFCGKEIEVKEVEVKAIEKGYVMNTYDAWWFIKSWLVPHTLNGKTTDVKECNFENLKDISSQDLPADIGNIVNENFWELTQPYTPPVKFKKTELTPVDFTGTTRPVGDIFPCNGVMLEVCDEVDGCGGCVWNNISCRTSIRGECHKHKRSTGRGCIFKVAK